MMTLADACALVRAHAELRQVRVSKHAAQRMMERNISVSEVLYVLRNASNGTYADGKWSITGICQAGDSLRIVVALDSAVVVVSAMGV
jgi:hypothetical protein